MDTAYGGENPQAAKLKHTKAMNESPKSVFQLTKEVEEKFWSLVEKSDGCWNWTGGKNNYKYGRFCIPHGKVVLAHRFAFQITHGKSSDLFVCHKCDNPSCVRPDHLFLGTPKDNTQDMFNKGRASKRSGENGPSHKLTTEQVNLIRSMYSGKYGDFTRISKLFGVTSKAIAQIIKRERWVNT